MEMIVKTSGSVAIVTLQGRFDAHGVPPVATWLQTSQDEGRSRILVNLEGVNFIDSMALSSQVRGLKHCREKSGDLYLSSLQQSVRVIFELTRLDNAFSIFQSESEALAAFSETR